MFFSQRNNAAVHHGKWSSNAMLYFRVFRLKCGILALSTGKQIYKHTRVTCPDPTPHTCIATRENTHLCPGWCCWLWHTLTHTDTRWFRWFYLCISSLQRNKSTKTLKSRQIADWTVTFYSETLSLTSIPQPLSLPKIPHPLALPTIPQRHLNKAALN